MQNDLLVKALELATQVHAGEKWRDGESSFLTHPLAVASLVLRFGGDEEQAAAALVHDTISDSRGSESEIARRVSPAVSKIAYAFADPELADVSPDWQTTKRAYLAKLRETDGRALLVVGAEELHEISDLLMELRQNPPHRVWQRYPTHPMNMAWYFKEVLTILNSNLKGSQPRKLLSEMAARVRQLSEQVFEGI